MPSHNPLPRESAIVAKILAWLDRQPLTWAFKTHGSPYSPTGLPDIIGAIAGHAFALEVKTPHGRPSPAQILYLQTIAASGTVTAVVHSLPEAQRALNPLLTPSLQPDSMLTSVVTPP